MNTNNSRKKMQYNVYIDDFKYIQENTNKAEKYILKTQPDSIT